MEEVKSSLIGNTPEIKVQSDENPIFCGKLYNEPGEQGIYWKCTRGFGHYGLCGQKIGVKDGNHKEG